MVRTLASVNLGKGRKRSIVCVTRTRVDIYILADIMDGNSDPALDAVEWWLGPYHDRARVHPDSFAYSPLIQETRFVSGM